MTLTDAIKPGRFFLFLAICLAAAAIANAAEEKPPGAIRLPEGYHHAVEQGIDSRVGKIWKEGGLEIHYDIGKMAGNYASGIAADERAWTKKQPGQGV